MKYSISFFIFILCISACSNAQNISNSEPCPQGLAAADVAVEHEVLGPVDEFQAFQPESGFTYPENADVRDTSKSLMSRASEELCLY